jgi:formylglycine-generating enzyme required for sulfatase activity
LKALARKTPKVAESKAVTATGSGAAKTPPEGAFFSAFFASKNASTAGIEWVTIPGGSSMMGYGGGKHQVTVKTFQMAKTLVTNKQYQACVSAGACTAPADEGDKLKGDDQPVVGVDWNQAKTFSEWAGGRLPSEAEWEYAARSGGKEQKYPWGDEDATCERAVIQGCGSATAPVCSKPAGNTQQGLCDMAGNAMEWVQDWYHNTYEGAPADGSAWENPTSSDRVDRGASGSSMAENAQSAYRHSDGPGYRAFYLGFRLARSTSPQESLPPQRAAAPPQPKPAVEQPAQAGIEWVNIPGGSFMMGSDDWSDTKPRHQVTIKSFQMAKTLVTNKQYQACVAAGACTAPDYAGESFKGDDQPAVSVDWNQAKAFSEWVGGRLPSETEWEYAARSGGKEQRYPWGDEEATCERAVMEYGCGRKATWPVCSKPTGNTKQGLCDMAGNVMEWVQDWYHRPYAGAPTDGSAWENPTGDARVARGGSWDLAAGGVRSALRYSNDPGNRFNLLGFRPSR